MSRVAKATIFVPDNIKIKLQNQIIYIEGKNGKLKRLIHKNVKVEYINNTIKVIPYIKNKENWKQAGTCRSLIYSMIIGVTKGFKKKLQLIGVGYRVSVQNNIISLSLGLSHIIKYKVPKGIIAECPGQNEIIISGANKEVVHQITANIRAYRLPDPYKGKGIRYENEIIRTKEAKKK